MKECNCKIEPFSGSQDCQGMSVMLRLQNYIKLYYGRQMMSERDDEDIHNLSLSRDTDLDFIYYFVCRKLACLCGTEQ